MSHKEFFKPASSGNISLECKVGADGKSGFFRHGSHWYIDQEQKIKATPNETIIIWFQ